MENKHILSAVHHIGQTKNIICRKEFPGGYGPSGLRFLLRHVHIKWYNNIIPIGQISYNPERIWGKFVRFWEPTFVRIRIR